MKISRMYDSLIVDVHGMRTLDAQDRLKSIIDYAGNDIKQIVVIHGFHTGQALKEMVRGNLNHPRITNIRSTSNEGETVLLIKKGKVTH